MVRQYDLLIRQYDLLIRRCYLLIRRCYLLIRQCWLLILYHPPCRQIMAVVRLVLVVVLAPCLLRFLADRSESVCQHRNPDLL